MEQKLFEAKREVEVAEGKGGEMRHKHKNELHQAKKESKYKLSKCLRDKEALYEYNQELEFKNQQLVTVLSSKTNEIK
jgi:hypothetical protein